MIKIVIDASGAVLGRLASYAAKQAIFGKEVIVVNCDNVIVSGTRNLIINEYKQIRMKGGTSLKGPHFPKNPERIVKRTIRNMIPYKKGKGLDAFKRVMCYNEVPSEYQNAEKISMPKILKINTMTLREISKVI